MNLVAFLLGFLSIAMVSAEQEESAESIIQSSITMANYSLNMTLNLSQDFISTMRTWNHAIVESAKNNTHYAATSAEEKIKEMISKGGSAAACAHKKHAELIELRDSFYKEVESDGRYMTELIDNFAIDYLPGIIEMKSIMTELNPILEECSMNASDSEAATCAKTKAIEVLNRLQEASYNVTTMLVTARGKDNDTGLKLFKNGQNNVNEINKIGTSVEECN